MAPLFTCGLTMARKTKSSKNLTRNPIAHVRNVFRRRDIPVEYHWKNNRRIPPIVIEPEVGWVVLRSRNDAFSDKGSHGWPSSQSKSYSIFYARGPAFRNGITVKPFRTVDLYPLMCKLLGIEPRPNNGSLANVEAVLKETNMVTLKGTQGFARPSLWFDDLTCFCGAIRRVYFLQVKSKAKMLKVLLDYGAILRLGGTGKQNQVQMIKDGSQCWKRTLPPLLRKMFLSEAKGHPHFFPTPKNRLKRINCLWKKQPSTKNVNRELKQPRWRRWQERHKFV